MMSAFRPARQSETPGLNEGWRDVDVGSVANMTRGSHVRRTTLFVIVFSLVLGMLGPSAKASGPGTIPEGVTDDPFSGAPASTSSSVERAGGFTFFGSGFGHGIGMSQWGSYGLAKQGWPHVRILKNFYRGTKVVRDPNPVRKLRIGITYDRSITHIGARSGPVRLWIGKPRGTAVGRIPAGKTWTVKATAKGYAIRDGAGKLIGGKAWGGSAFDLFATYANTGARVFVKEADAVSGVGYAYNRAHLEFNLYRGGGSWQQRIIVPITMEQYLYGIGEMPSSWPAEALQTQAVAARTFATYTTRNYAIRGYCNCDLTDGANDQVYIGYNKEGGAMGSRWVRAVKATTRQIVTRGDGKVIQAFFAASNGGHSDAVEDVWHGGNPAFAVSYLKAECDPGEYTGANPWTDWKRTLTASALTSRLSPYTGGIGRVTGFPKVRRGRGGRIISATVEGTSGRSSITGSQLKGAVSAWDGRIWINRNKNIVGAIRAKYDALMCRPGLPTSPVAKVGSGSRQKFQVGGIYRNGRADVSVWLKGPIYKEYVAAGGAPGRLKLPSSQVKPVPGTRGARILFTGGRIYSKGGAGTHALWGKVLGVYLARGAAKGPLGFPTDQGPQRIRRAHRVVRARLDQLLWRRNLHRHLRPFSSRGWRLPRARCSCTPGLPRSSWRSWSPVAASRPRDRSPSCSMR